MYRQIITNFGDVDVTLAWTGMLNEDASSSHEIVNDTELYFAFSHIKEWAAKSESAAIHNY